jgi:hypothetical protein
MLYGLSGCEGAGKTTVANILCYGSPNPEFEIVTMAISNSAEFVLAELFELEPGSAPDPIWKMTYEEADQLITGLMRRYVDSGWSWDCCAREISFYQPLLRVSLDVQFVELSLAEPLKRVSAVLFNVDYTIIAGRTPESRVARENSETLTVECDITGPLTGRGILEYFGTNVLRNCFDQLIWMKILQRRCAAIRATGVGVIISDVRFINEKDVLANMGGALIVIYRDETDLEITDTDATTHPAKWEFKTFINATADLPIKKFHNNGPLEELPRRLTELILE